MGHQQQGHFFLVEIMLQPFYHLHVQVIGRFIHDQQHMLVLEADVDQGLGQRYPLALPPG